MPGLTPDSPATTSAEGAPAPRPLPEPSAPRRGSFFWRLYGAFAVLVLTSAVVFGLLARGVLRENYEQRQLDLMQASCSYLAEFAVAALADEGEGGRQIERAVAALAQSTDHRITVISADGNPLLDTSADAERMENHASRPEVIAALAEGTGSDIRRSATLGKRMLYVARRVKNPDGDTGVVRVAVPMLELEQEQSLLIQRLMLGAVFGVLLALLLGLFFARRITRPIHQMTVVALKMRKGRYDARIHDLPDNEFGVLGDALNQLGLELTLRLADVSRDEAQLRAMLAAMEEGVIAVDDHERVVFVNSAARKLLRLGNQNVAGTRLVELAPKADLIELITEARGEAASRRELLIGEQPRVSRIQAEAQAFSAGATRGVVVVLQDITELRRLERVRRDFVANVSHELKTPLTSVRGYVETLLDGAMDDLENRERFLEKIEANVVRLNHLVMDLLSLARIESQQEGLQVEKVALRRIVESVVARHEDEMRAKELDCEVLPGDVRVSGDPESLTQVVDNLVSNAIKYTPEQGRIEIELDRVDAQGRLRVRDTGIGIPARDLDRIFERFYRVDKARSREMGGTGLGLSIVKHLVQTMDGEVEVASEKGLGSCFTVWVPAAD